MNQKSVQVWVDNYVEAWRTYDPAQIGDLFSEDALYYYSPFDEQSPVRGLDEAGRCKRFTEWYMQPRKS